MKIKKNNLEEPGNENLLGSNADKVSTSRHKSPSKRYSEIMNSEPRKKKKFIVPEFEDSLFVQVL